MLRGIYTTNTGLNSAQHRLDTLSHNLANVNTPGFKQQEVTFTTFQEAILTVNGEKPIGKLTHGSKPEQVLTDFSQGRVIETGRELDFAIQGDAFFCVDTPEGERYTRDGAFSCDINGYLVDKNGNRVLGVSGKDGTIMVVNGKPDQDFRLVTVPNKELLIYAGKGLFRVPANETRPAENVQVWQGFLEESNTDLIQNMTDIMAIAKSYAMNSRVLMVQDKILEKTVNEVGKLK